MKQHKKVLKLCTGYVFFDVLDKLVPFLLLPILTHALGAHGYGQTSMFITLVGVFSVLVGINMHGAVGVNFFKLERPVFNEFMSTVGGVLIISAFIVALTAFMLSSYLYEYIGFSSLVVFMAVLVSLFQFTVSIGMVILQSEHKVKTFGILKVAQTFANFSISILFVVVIGLDWQGRVWAIVIASGAFSLISVILLIYKGYYARRVKKQHLIRILKFGVPLIPHKLSNWARVSVDRFILLAFLGTSSVGVYAAGYQIAGLVLILSESINRAVAPILYKKMSTLSEIEKISVVRWTYVLFAAILSMAIFSGLFCKLFLTSILGEEFKAAADIVLLVALGKAFHGMYIFISNYVFYEEKTHMLSVITMVMTAIHCAMTYFFVQEIGINGAAYSTTMSYFFSFVFVWILSSYTYKMPWFNAIKIRKA